MYYTVFDAPVTCFSRPEEIAAWIRELRSQTSRPEFQYAENRKRLDEAIEEAERCYVESQSIHGQAPRKPAV